VDSSGKILVGADDVVIARIVRARGIKGEVACSIETDFPERFELLNDVTVVLAEGARPALRIERFWFHKGRVIVKFEGYNTMSAAETLVGGLLVVPQSETMALQEGEFYEHEVVGSTVADLSGSVIGVVSRLLRTGGTDLLVVEGGQGQEYLIPFTDSICVDVDISRGRVTVDVPEGLLEL
jgi:16S rRNA processing protein RimM